MADELMKVQGTLARQVQEAAPLTVGMLYRRLCAAFPEADGEAWDRYGMTVGDPQVPVSRVAVALDATVGNVRRAAELGAEVLVTHHPVYIGEAPGCIMPFSLTPNAGGVLWEAAKSGVAVMSFHTCLDAQPAATALLPDMLSLQAGDVWKPLGQGSEKGFGRVCRPREGDPLTLGTLASRCTAVFGVQPRVWGDFVCPVQRVLTWCGSLGSEMEGTDLSQLDVVVCGEVKYHEALRLAEAGIGVIELGHDVSELPYALLFAGTLQECGMDKAAIYLLDRGPHWALPEAIRV